MYHLCPDPVTPQAPSQGRTACDFTTATISLGVFFKSHCTCEEDIYLLHRKEELSYLIKFPPAILFHFANIYRIVDSTQTPNQQSGWSVFFPEWQSPFWRPESGKWVPESTKWVPESTKWDPESTKGESGSRIKKVGKPETTNGAARPICVHDP